VENVVENAILSLLSALAFGLSILETKMKSLADDSRDVGEENVRYGIHLLSSAL